MDNSGGVAGKQLGELTCGASAPARGHHEAGDHQTETDAQVPVADVGDRVARRSDVEGHDPEQAQEHQTEHHRGEPRGVGHGRLGIALDWGCVRRLGASLGLGHRNGSFVEWFIVLHVFALA